MFLTSKNLVHFLLRKQLISYSSVVDGDLKIIETTRRNRDFKVIRQHAPGYFIKQIKYDDFWSRSTLGNEVRFYEMLNSDIRFRPMKSLVPNFIASDEKLSVIVLELLPNSESLFERQVKAGGFYTGIYSAMGRLIGSYHNLSKKNLAIKRYGFPSQIPWILNVCEKGSLDESGFSTANRQLLGFLQANNAFRRHFDHLKAELTFDTLIHGDLKWDNCVTTFKNENTAPTFKLVDWELVGWGDADWDLAGVIQGFLSHWIFSFSPEPGIPLERLLTESANPIKTWRPALYAFWKSYVATTGGSECLSDYNFARVLKYAAGRLVQAVFEHLDKAAEMTSYVWYILQLSITILEDPYAAARILQGTQN